jgi:hypothetical protein
MRVPVTIVAAALTVATVILLIMGLAMSSPTAGVLGFCCLAAGCLCWIYARALWRGRKDPGSSPAER